jgi:hypothetical protein
MNVRVLLALLAVAALPAGVGAQPARASLPRLAIDLPSGAELQQEARGPFPVPIAVRTSGRIDDRALAGTVADLAARKLRVWLAIESPASPDAVPAWRSGLQALLSRHRDAIDIVEVVLPTEPKLAAFVVRTAATEARRDAGRRATRGVHRGARALR